MEGSFKPNCCDFFALEVLTLGQLSLPVLIPTLIASFVASTTSHLLGLEKFSHFVANGLAIDLETFIKLALLGLAFGLAGNLLPICCHWLKRRLQRFSQILTIVFFWEVSC
ncbi:MAG: chloride channel protein [Streptococcus sp.]